MSDNTKIKNPSSYLPDEALDAASGGIQAGQIFRDYYTDEFGNLYVRDENGVYQRADQKDQHEKKPSYL